MLGVRILSAFILLPLLLWGFVSGPPLVVLGMMSFFVALSIGELSGKLQSNLEARFGDSSSTPEEGRWFRNMTLALGIWTIGLHGWTPDNNLQAEILPAYFPSLFDYWLDFYAFLIQVSPEEWVLVCLVLLVGVGAFSGPTVPKRMARLLAALAAYTYGTLPWIVVYKLYHMGPHARYIILVMAITWMGDTGAYFGGRFLGGKIFGPKPFAPEISPKKTWEGSLVGLCFSVLGAVGANLFFDESLASWPLILVLGLLGGISAQFGDLIESLFKRFIGVKDSGNLIPGHGGFLDRVDATFFCGPMCWFLLRLFS